MTRKIILSLVLASSFVACKSRDNNDKKNENTTAPAPTIEEQGKIATDGSGKTVVIDEIVAEKPVTGAPAVEIETPDVVTDPGTLVPPVFIASCDGKTSKYCIFGPHAAETIILTSSKRYFTYTGFGNTNIGLKRNMCLRAIAKAAGDYVNANQNVLNQFRDKQVSVWTMVRLYDYTSDQSKGVVSPGIHFLTSAANKSVFDGKWIVRGSIDKNGDCLTPSNEKLAADFAFAAKEILPK